MTAYVMFGKKENEKKNDRIFNIDKEKYEINSLQVYSCYDCICKEIFVVRFRKINTNLLYTPTILITCIYIFPLVTYKDFLFYGICLNMIL